MMEHTTPTPVKQAQRVKTIGVLADDEWNSFVYINDLIAELDEEQEESEDEGQPLTMLLKVRKTGMSVAEDVTMHLADEKGWEIECSEANSVKSALTEFLRTCDEVVFFLSNQDSKLNTFLRQLQKHNPHLRIKVG